MKFHEDFRMIFLREITRDDIDIFNHWRNDFDLIDCLVSPFRYINKETDESWFENYLKNRDKNVRCSICITETRNVVGVVYLLNIDFISRNAEFGIMIGNKEFQNKGIGTLATKNILKHGFNNLNLHRISLAVLEDNQRAIKMYQKCGFIKEGVWRDSVYKNGKYKNLIYMSILKEEFETLDRGLPPFQ